MALVTRENSGLKIRMDKRGRQVLYVDGKRFPAISVKVESANGCRGIVTIETLSELVTFENYEEPRDES